MAKKLLVSAALFIATLSVAGKASAAAAGGATPNATQRIYADITVTANVTFNGNPVDLDCGTVSSSSIDCSNPVSPGSVNFDASGSWTLSISDDDATTECTVGTGTTSAAPSTGVTVRVGTFSGGVFTPGSDSATNAFCILLASSGAGTASTGTSTGRTGTSAAGAQVVFKGKAGTAGSPRSGFVGFTAADRPGVYDGHFTVTVSAN